MKTRKAVALLGAAIAILLAGRAGRALGIDLSEYLSVRCSGADGAGTARGDFDYTGFERAVMAQEGGLELEGILRFESTLVVSVEPESGLENGDEVTVTATWDGDAAKGIGIAIDGDRKTFVVTGLSGAGGDLQGGTAELDAFDPAYWDAEGGIEIRYSGVSPYGYLEIIDNLPPDHPLKGVWYDFDEWSAVREGDRLTVTASWKDRDLAKDWHFRQETAEYTVGAVDHCLWEFEELDEAALAAVEQSVRQAVDESASGFLEFRDGDETVGFYNGEEISVRESRIGDAWYAIRNGDGFIEALAVPCYRSVTVRPPEWMEDAQTRDFDLVYLCTVPEIVGRSDGAVSHGAAELRMRGTRDTEDRLMEELLTWYADPTLESVARRTRQ